MFGGHVYTYWHAAANVDMIYKSKLRKSYQTKEDKKKRPWLRRNSELATEIAAYGIIHRLII